MGKEDFYQQSEYYLKILCDEIRERHVGSPGNRQATDFFKKEISSFGWEMDVSELNVLDWEDGGASLIRGEETFNALVSPYSHGCRVKGTLIGISNIEELERAEISGQIVLLYGDIAKEPLMPKNFVFYNPEGHRKIISILEEKKPAALISATGRNPALAGGVYPFPMFEDGDFNIPSVYMTEEEGNRLLSCRGTAVQLESRSKRIPEKAYNVIARKGRNADRRIVITAHIDAKKGSPGAIDNASGVVILLLIARMLQDYKADPMIEIAAFNGEDYYAVPGQMDYILKNHERFSTILLNINIDGAGYREGKSSLSLFNLPEGIEEMVHRVIKENEGITEGIQWPQGDHSIFIQQGCPAIALSSKWLIDNMESQDITHTPKDNSAIVDCRKIVETAVALSRFLEEICRNGTI